MSATIYINNTQGGKTQLFAVEPARCLTVQLDDKLSPIYGEVARVEDAPGHVKSEVANRLLKETLKASIYNSSIMASSALMGGYSVQLTKNDCVEKLTESGICHFRCDITSNGKTILLAISYNQPDGSYIELAYLVPSFGKIGDIYDRFIADLIAASS